jgi:hypothetical protein
MSKAGIKNLPMILADCKTEEEVKSEFAKFFKYKLDTRLRMDLYTSNILFEFKYSRNFQAHNTKAPVIAQALYYIREIKYGKLELSVPAYICVVDKNEAFFVETTACKAVYDSQDEKFDWDRAPSTPCPNIVKAVSKLEKVKHAHVYSFSQDEDFDNFKIQLGRYSQFQPELDFSIFDKKSITEDNFETAFRLWSEDFGPYVENGRKAAEYFLSDLQDGKSQILRDTSEVAFDMGDNTLIKKPMPLEKYEHFWKTYSKISDLRIIHSIWQRVDRLSVEDFRRFTGEFYTPVTFAKKGLDYLEKIVGERWWEKGYRLWDMAAGTGNLEYDIPEEALPYCYISTFLKEDAEYCARLYPQATVFQYDYLNDDVALLHHGGLDIIKTGVPPKMPKKLFDDLQNPEIKWIVFINPPFATSNVGARDSTVSKDSVSITVVRSLMAEEGLLETSRELFSQFLWRISRDFSDKQAHLGMFSKIKYINANNDQKMRETFFRFSFEGGFCFPSKAFPGNKGDFPVGFLVWNLGKTADLRDQSIELDVFNVAMEKIGRKQVPSVDRHEALSKWVDRPPTTKVLPPLQNAITVGDSHKDVRDRVAERFLFSLMAAGNDFSQQNKTALLAGPYVSAGGMSVTPENFDKAMVWHAVRRIPKATWLNDRDQWMQPTSPLPEEFVADCVVWSAFSNSNQVSSLAEISYQGETYDLPNQLFPYTLDEVRAWSCTLSSIQSSLQSATKDRFFAEWLRDRRLSLESQSVVDAGKVLYQLFFANSASMPWPQFKIKRWDVGLYQVRRALNEVGQGAEELESLNSAQLALRAKLLPQISELGFLQGVERLFEDEMETDPAISAPN